MTESKGRVLIVEDALDIQNVLARLLRSCGYHVDCANNGLEALEYLNQAPELPHLILLDLMMPQMDGYDFRKEQEKDPRFGSIPVVAMTADGNVEIKSLRIGAKSYLKKPFSNLDVILETISRCIEDRIGES